MKWRGFLLFISLIHYNYLAIYGYFMHPMEEDTKISQYTSGMLRLKFQLRYTPNTQCSKLDEDQDPIPSLMSIIIISCAIKRGCEDDFRSGTEKNVCNTSKITRNEMFKKYNSTTHGSCNNYFYIFKMKTTDKSNVNVSLVITNYFKLVFSYVKFFFNENYREYTVVCDDSLLEFPIGANKIAINGAFDVSSYKPKCNVQTQLFYWYECDQFYNGPSCLFKCVADNRKHCSPGVKYNKEDCTPGWSAIPVNVYLTNKNDCGVEYRKTEIIYRCLVINKCQSKDHVNTCEKGFICLAEFNNTSVCGKFNHFYYNPRHPEMKNFTRQTITDNETVFINVTETINKIISVKAFRTFWQLDTGTSEETFTMSGRQKKNLNFVIEGNKFTLVCRDECIGIDYSIIGVVMSTDGQSFEFRAVFKLINIDIKFVVDNSIYVHYGERLRLITKGGPKELMTLIITRPDISFTFRTTLAKVFSFPRWKAKLFNLNVSVSLKTEDGLYYEFVTSTYHSTRAFFKFYWKDSKYILKNKDILECIVSNRSDKSVLIRQVYGETEINDILDTKLVIGVYKPGEYIVACIITISDSKETFYRYKMFEIHKDPTNLCILPFAPAVGILLKCYCIVFPPGDDRYSMVLTDVVTGNLIISTVSNYLRIPYIILHSRKYQITCNYDDYFNGVAVNLVKTVNFSLNEKSEIPAINYNRECMEYGSLPEEYLLKESNSIDSLIFFNQLFYLKRNEKVVFNFIILVLAISLNNLMHYTIYWGSKNNEVNQVSAISAQNSKIYRRNFMRRINNKITNVSTREIEKYKELFITFRDKHLSIAKPSEDTKDPKILSYEKYSVIMKMDSDAKLNIDSSKE